MVNARSGTRYELRYARGTYLNYSKKTLKIYNYHPQMNMIPNFLKKYIYNNDDEKKLAIKISIASFLIFISILISIIGTSYIYEYREINRELRTESNMIDMNPGIREVIKNENIPIFR